MNGARDGRAALLGVALLVACAHAPERGEIRGRHATRSPVADRSPAEAATATAPEQAAAAGVPEVAPRAPEPEVPADLFDRMRSGFGLPSVEDRAVLREIDWYRGHPGHLARTF